MPSSSNFPIIRTTKDDFKASNPGAYRDIWTEIVINAPPEKVRTVFLDFENRPKWDPFYRHFEFKESIKTKISFTINEKCDGNKKKDFKVPLTCTISKNDDEGIIWGCKLLGGHLLKVDHVQLFQPITENDGGDKARVTKKCRLVNYERQAGLIRYLTNVKTYSKAFQASNEALKRVCEEDI